MRARVHWSSVLLSGVVMFGGLVADAHHAVKVSCTNPNHICLSVSPKGGYDPTRAINGTGYTTVFSVYNWGNAATIEFACSNTGGVSCTGLSSDLLSMGAGQTIYDTVTYNVGASGGTITFEALGGTTRDTGYRQVDTPPNLDLALPAITGADSAVVHSRTPLILAKYSTNDAALDTTSLVVVLGSDTVTGLARANSRLMEWEIDTSRALAPGTPRSLTIKICNVAAACNTRTWRLVLDNSGAPIVSFSGMPLEAHGRHFVAPFGPGVTVSGPDVETGISTPTYTTMGVARSAGLVYSTRQAYPRALVNTGIELNWPAGTPDQLKAALIDGTTRMDSLTVASPNCSGGGGRKCRITLQGDFSGTTWAGAVRKWLKVEVGVTYSGTTKTSVDSVEVVLVDRRGSPYGRGWYAANQPMLYAAGNDMILVSPTGAATVYRGAGRTWIAPPGDHSVLTAAAAAYAISYRDGSSISFDSAHGRPTRTTDEHSNWNSISYDSLTPEAESLLTDPVAYRSFFVTYTSTAITIKDSVPGHAGARRTVIGLNGSNQVTYDSIFGSDGSRLRGALFGYSSVGVNNANVLASVTDAAGSVSSLVYDARVRPIADSLPAVLDESGSTLKRPVIGYRAVELRGLDTLVSSDSLYVRVTDPLTHWTRSRVNRWGAAIVTWDALGTISRTTYSAEGMVLWTEGKVADSTRVYFAYDNLGRLARSYRLRTSSDTIQLDTFLYDAHHNVIRHKNALGLRDSMVYGGFGAYHDLLHSWTPSGEKTDLWYFSNGQLDSVHAPQQAPTYYVYDATTKNLLRVSRGGIARDSNLFDTYGRLIESDTKASVRQSHDTTFMAWRRRRVWYNALNQVDSVRFERTAECLWPCTTPTWPSGSDTSKYLQVKHLYDALGRDTARVGTTGKRTRYVYDALGRLRMRFPYADSSAIVDSFRYDLAGNLRHQWTRRGYQIDHLYDTRNRDTSTTVPTVGTYRRSYAGPNDELTRVWLYNWSDPVGGLQPEHSWVYSQAGLIVSDTAGGRAATHAYDRLGRDSTRGDLLGTWKFRYDQTRGTLDSLITPFNDTLQWVADSLWRPIGPYIANGTLSYSYVMTYDDREAGTNLTVSQGATQVGYAALGGDAFDHQMNFVPSWTDHHGSAIDSLAHDGWNRVSAALYSGTSTAVDSFNFDNDGNITPQYETRTYDVVTRRLTLRTGLNSHYYVYDRSGNVSIDSVTGAVWKYWYDALERLDSVKYNGTLIARYGYDVLGHRVVKRVYNAGPYGATVGYTRMVYAGSQVIAETDSAWNKQLGYTWDLGTDNLMAIHKYGTGAGDWYTVPDAIHSVRGLQKRDGTWAVNYRYRVYGALLDSSGTAPFELHYRWTGREFDSETGLYFFRTRQYDPNADRFTQEDVSGYAGGENLYAYGNGDPTVGRDPSGMGQDYEVATPPANFWATVQCLAAWDHYSCSTPIGGGAGGGGGGGMDWNGDGIDDNEEFSVYAWGKQEWMADGGNGDDYRHLYNSAMRFIDDGQTKRQFLDNVNFGVYQPVTTEQYIALEARVVAALGLPEGTITMAITFRNYEGTGTRTVIDPSILTLQSGAEIAFTVAHEMAHQDWYYHHAAPSINSERSSDCFAFMALGWNSPNTECYPQRH